ncbi:MAG: dockerin type I repeat-containing protein, partial [Oscillospiraceae bacterium]|nr:dockerin type I repeat-containing protein [Oscillospiraceae bacterium]
AALGDVNGDGTVDANDVILLRQYISKNDVGYIDLVAADVNGDGVVNSKDVILLRQYIAKYNVTLG